MKKLFLTIAAFAIGFSVNAVELKANYFIKNTGETMNCKKIQFGANDIKVVMENGEKLIIAKDQIIAIRVNGKFFEKLPLYVNNAKTNKEEFMQFVTTRAGLKLYKYPAEIGNNNGLKGFNADGYKTDCYVVYKSNQFYVAINDSNYATLFQFFGIPYSEK